MQNESDLFLPSRSDEFRRRRFRRAPCMSSHLFHIFEQSTVYGCCLFLAFSITVIVGTRTTYEEYRESSTPILIYIELTLFIYCFIEFLLRIYASESRMRYQGVNGKVRYIYERYLIIDLTLLISYGTAFTLHFIKFYDTQRYFLHCLRFLQLLRFISLDRYIKSIPLISFISWQYRQVLCAAIYICFLLLLPTAYFLWMVERHIETNGQFFFKTYSDSLWFTINSMATVIKNILNNIYFVIIVCFFVLI